MGGAQVQRHDDREPVEQQVIDDADDRADEHLAIGDQDGGTLGQLGELFLAAQSLRFDDFVLWYEEEAHDGADDGERQCEPEGLVFAEHRHDEARQVSAKHANAQREAGPEEAGGGGQAGGADVLRHQDHEAVDEQRVADAAQGVQAQNQRIQTTRDGDPEKQQVDADPPAGTEHHDAAGTEHFGEHAGAPAAEGREQAVHSDQQGGLRGREALVDHEFGEEGELESVAGHEDGNGKEAKQQHTGNTEFFKKANHGLTPSTSLSVEVVQGKMRPPEEKGKAGGQAILAAKTVRRNLFLPLAGGGAQHRRVVIHAAGCLPSVGSAASSPQGEEPAKCRNYSPTLTTALETPWILPSRKSWTSSSPSSWLMSGATFILPDSSRLMASLKVSGLMKEP